MLHVYVGTQQEQVVPSQIVGTVVSPSCLPLFLHSRLSLPIATAILTWTCSMSEDKGWNVCGHPIVRHTPATYDKLIVPM